jgi:hypothetical protein
MDSLGCSEGSIDSKYRKKYLTGNINDIIKSGIPINNVIIILKGTYKM